MRLTVATFDRPPCGLESDRILLPGLRSSNRQPSWAELTRLQDFLLPLIDRNVGKIAWADIFRARTDEFVVGILLEDVTGPAADPADGKDRRVEIERNSHHVVSGCREEVYVGIQTLFFHHHFLSFARHLIPLRVARRFAHLS